MATVIAGEWDYSREERDAEAFEEMCDAEARAEAERQERQRRMEESPVVDPVLTYEPDGNVIFYGSRRRQATR